MKTLTIGKTLAAGFAAVILLIVALGAFSYARMHDLKTRSAEISAKSLPSVQIVGQVHSNIERVFSLALQHAAAADSREMARVEEDIAEIRRVTTGLLKSYADLIRQDRDRELFAAMGERRKEFWRVGEEVLRLSKLSTKESKQKAVQLTYAELRPIHDRYMAAAKELIAFNQQSAADVERSIAASVDTSQTAIIIGLIAAMGIATLIAATIVRAVSKPLHQAIVELESAAHGLAGAAGQLSSSSQALAQGSQEQAASIEETSASTEEIQAMARKNSEQSRAAAELMRTSREKFEQTDAMLENAVTVMKDISEHSGEISKIIKTIDEIAFQTNILALNAAVEAARAGEAGQGFAVVAEEVRSLAQRSAKAAQDTAVLIESSIARSADGTRRVDEVAASVRGISDAAKKASELVTEVSQASHEQAHGTEQIGRAITQINQVTQRSAAAAQQSASAAEELTAEADALKHVIDRLSALAGRDKAGAYASRSAA